MITREQAMTESRFHEDGCRVDRGKTGKAQPRLASSFQWRRNGATKTWVTRPDEFQVPIKHGLHSYSYITQDNARYIHLESECEALAEINEWWAKRTQPAVTLERM